MYGTNFRAPKVDVHQFSMIPRAEIPRSSFRMQHNHKTTFSASSLYPIFVTEVLPGDSFALNMTAFCRMSTPIYPLMDNLELESWFFFVPNRLVWSHWVNFMGEQRAGPAESISYSIPQIVSPAGGFTAFSIYDYMGIPIGGPVSGANTLSINALPFRACNMIFNEWFRDENLDTAVGYGAANTVYDLGDGPDPYTNYACQIVRKRHDYFTSCLPWTQKGAAGPVLLLGGQATVKANATDFLSGAQPAPIHFLTTTAGAVPAANTALTSSGSGGAYGTNTTAAGAYSVGVYPSNLYADMTTVGANTINALRLAFQTQRLLERDARGGTRYTEIIRSHFGVISPDMRLQRPEYLGGGRSPVNIAPVPQTVPATLSGTSNPPMGTLAAVGTSVLRPHGFRQSFTEHGHIIGLIAVRRDNAYQYGLRRMWTRLTRYDFYFPVFAMLGEQGVRNDEIYAQGISATDTAIFGYQERWAEYRYHPSIITGFFRSTNATPLDSWHCATKYTSLPALNSAFIQDDTVGTLFRNLAAGAASNNQEFLADMFFDMRVARPMPLYSVPGKIDHF